MIFGKSLKLGIGALMLVSGLGFGGLATGSNVATAAAFKPGDVTYEKDYGVKTSLGHKYSLKTRGVVAKDGKSVNLVVRITNLENKADMFRVGVSYKSGYMDLYPKWASFTSKDKKGAYKDVTFAKKTGTYYIGVSLDGKYAKEVKTTHTGKL